MRISAGILALLVLAGCSRPVVDERSSADRPPNVIIVLADDLGYGDVGVFGSSVLETPNLDRLADEGIRFTNFLVPSSVCTPSRAALLTGSYPVRVGLPAVLFPRSDRGLNPAETTLPEMLRSAGYATLALGKWHLGDHPTFLPTNHGFDHYFGLPYSNDMSPEPANNPSQNAREWPPLPLIRDTVIVEREPDQALLTRRMVDEATAFMEANRDRPFFIYFASPFPHVPLYASEEFRGSSAAGLYGDVVAELDDAVGEMVARLRELDLDQNTLLVFLSDNGPWRIYGNHAGSSGGLREGKMTTFEGGHRVPFIAWWPGQIPEGAVSDEVITSMDLLPTVSRLAGTSVPDTAMIDGRDVWPLLHGEAGASSPHEAVFYYYRHDLQAVRANRWKLHVPHGYPSAELGAPGSDGKGGRSSREEIGLALFDLETDPGERVNVADQHPEIVARLTGYLETARADLGDDVAGVTGAGVRPVGQVDQSWREQD